MIGFEIHLTKRGIIPDEARRITQALNLVGIWDELMSDGKDALRLKDE